MILPRAPTILVTTHRPNDDGNSTKVRQRARSYSLASGAAIADLLLHRFRHHSALVDAHRWPDHTALLDLERKAACTKCGMIGAEVRPSWSKRPYPESLTGTQWRQR
jgi:hypothetical protein